MRILYVEDDAILALVNQDKIEDVHAGIVMDVAPTYAEAVELLIKNTYDLVVSDFCFPGRIPRSDDGGKDLYVYMGQNAIRTPLIFMSGSGTSYVIAEMKKTGVTFPADDVFSKPRFVTDVLAHAVEKYMPKGVRPWAAAALFPKPAS